MRETIFTLDQDEMGAEGGYSREHDSRAIGDDFVPAETNGIDGGRGHEAEGAAEIVGADEEDAAGWIAGAAGVVVDVIFVGVFARVDQGKSGGGAIGAEIVDFAGGVAVGHEEEIGAATAAFDVDAEAFVFFLVEKSVWAGGG